MVRNRLLHVFLCLLLACSACWAQSVTAPRPTFVDGEAQKIEAFSDSSTWIRHDLWVEAEFDSDGDGKPDRMHVGVTRPAQTEGGNLKLAVIYESSPYFAGTSSTDKQFFWNPRQEVGATPPPHKTPPPIRVRKLPTGISRSQTRTWVSRGFAVVHSSAPGTGQSQGCPTVGGPIEALAPKAVIDWLNGRAKGYTTVDGDEEVTAFWSTGKVGMIGTSYNGTIPLAAATTGVEGLEAIIPIAPNTSYYHYYRSNGLVRHPGGWMGEDIDVLYNFIASGFPDKRAFCDKHIRDTELLNGFDRVTGDYNDFWHGRDMIHNLDKVRAATLMSHGFNDWNVMPEHSNRIYQALKKKGLPCMAFYHQGGHGGPPPLAMINRWFSRYLYGVRNGVEKDPRAWIVREGKSQRFPTAYADYPNPAASPVTLHPSKGGNGMGQLRLQGARTRTTEGITDDVAITGAKLAAAAKSRNRLLYATPKLTSPVHISGTARIKIRVSSSRKAANLSVWLVSLPWTKSRKINDNIITRGWADPQNSESLTSSKPLVPWKFYDLTFDLQPDDQIIPAGQQIGLMIFSSDRDFTLWPRAGTKLKVDLANTTLELPIVGGVGAFKAAGLQ